MSPSFVSRAFVGTVFQSSVQLLFELGLNLFPPIRIPLFVNCVQGKSDDHEKEKPFDQYPEVLVVKFCMQGFHLVAILNPLFFVMRIHKKPVAQFVHPGQILHIVLERNMAEPFEVEASSLNHVLFSTQAVEYSPDHYHYLLYYGIQIATSPFGGEDTQGSQLRGEGSLYAKIQVKTGDSWKLLNGKTCFETFESEVRDNTAVFQQPFELHYTAEDIRGWPRFTVQVWLVDKDGRHTIAGYGTAVCPFHKGEYENFEINCWRPKGTWFDNFIGAHSELQYKGVVLSSLSRYGLKTYSTGRVSIDMKIITKDFHLHGVKLEQ